MKTFYSWSIRTHLLILVVLAIAPALAIILYSGFENRDRSRHHAEHRITQQVQTLAENHARTMAGTRQLLMTLAEVPSVRSGDTATCTTLLRDLLKQNPLFLNILIADSTGRIIASALPQQGVSVADRDYFRQILATRRPALGDYTISRTAHKAAMHYGYPVLNSDGSLRAVAIVAFDLEQYGRTFSLANLPAESALTLTSHHGTRIYRFPDSTRYFGVTDLPAMVQRMSGPEERGTFSATGVDGVMRLYGFQRLRLERTAAPLFIRVGIPEALVAAEADTDLQRNLLFMTAATLLAVLFAWLLGNIFFIRRLARLVSVSQSIGNGDLEARTGIACHEGEFGQLASSLDDMADQLQEKNRERSLAETALKDSEHRLNLVLQGSSDGFWDWDMKSREVKHSERWAEMLGYAPEEVAPHVRSWKSLVHPDDMPAVIQVFKDHLAGRKQQYRIEYRMRCKNGSWKWILDRGRVVAWDDQGTPLRMAGTATDISERKQAEEENKLLTSQLLQAQKMEAVGQLAGGIAHDFNNILTAIVGYGNLLLMKTAHDDTMKNYAEHILTAADRGAGLTKSLLAFGRRQLMLPQPVQLHEILVRVEKLLLRLIGEDIELCLELTTDEPILMADAGQIEQVLMNLATNARDAMPGGGRITIRTERVTLAAAAPHGITEPGCYAVISFSDSGTGMAPEILDKIFEPFFTTKEVGKGSGLGLAMVYGIIQQHNGQITVNSAPGQGTTFTIFLPLHAGSTSTSNTAEPFSCDRGSETILVAEDDEVIRNLTKSLLEAHGYRVILAMDGEHTITQYLEHRDQVNLLILDLVLPKRNGRDVYLLIKEMDPAVRALFMSGYTADILEQKGLRDIGLDFMAKPIRPEVLLRRVREILDGEQTPPPAL